MISSTWLSKLKVGVWFKMCEIWSFGSVTKYFFVRRFFHPSHYYLPSRGLVSEQGCVCVSILTVNILIWCSTETAENYNFTSFFKWVRLTHVHTGVSWLSMYRKLVITVADDMYGCDWANLSAVLCACTCYFSIDLKTEFDDTTSWQKHVVLLALWG